jgi:hypothetical protein
MQYITLYMHRCEQSGGQESVFEDRTHSLVHLPTRLLTLMHVKHTNCIYNSLREDEPTKFETCRRQMKLNIYLETCVFRWFVLYNYITMHCAKNTKRYVSSRTSNCLHTVYTADSVTATHSPYLKVCPLS